MDNVIIESLDFKKLLNKYKDVEDAFIYLDPPYFGVPNYYGVNFSEEDHKKMLDILKNAKAKWLLSGYANKLYDSELKDFYRLEIPLSKPSYVLTEKSKHRPIGIEILWANYKID